MLRRSMSKPTLKRWSPRQQLFIRWLATPEVERSPETQAELAQQLGLRPETLVRWRGQPGFEQTVLADTFSRMRQRVPQILNVVAKKAEAGDYRFVQLALTLMNIFQNMDQDGFKLPPYTKDDLNRAIVEVATWKIERFGDAGPQEEV